MPEKFHELRWTRLPGGETSPAFVERMRRPLMPEASAVTTVALSSVACSVRTLPMRA